MSSHHVLLLFQNVVISTVGKKITKFKASQLWNQLPNKIKEIKSESLFKSRIKVYLGLYNKLYTEWLWSIVYKWHILMVWLVLTYCMWYDLDILDGYRPTQHISVLYVFLCMYCIFFIWLLGGQLWWACALSGSLVAFFQINIVVVLSHDCPW